MTKEDNQSEIGFTDLHDVASSVKDVDQEKPEKLKFQASINQRSPSKYQDLMIPHKL